jgi:hypothetical protein
MKMTIQMKIHQYFNITLLLLYFCS